MADRQLGSTGFVVPMDGGESGTADRRRVVRLGSPDTDGAVAVLTTTVRPGMLVPPHYHENENEAWHIISGKVGLLLGDEFTTASAGDFVWRPRGQIHANWVLNGEPPAQVVSCVIPGGWDRALLDLDRKVEAGEFDEEAFVATAQEYGIHFDFDKGRELADRFDLQLLGAGG